ncbi:MAG TPA: glycosyltransferase family 2 protein [Xanthobacteraceae bacterium]|nr:glycosyltransferase family 2 protein [Xanthobacteraceae bacterium]
MKIHKKRSVRRAVSRGFRHGSQKLLNLALKTIGLRRRDRIEKVIRQQYRLCLQREPSRGELAQWYYSIDTIGLSLGRVLKNISKLSEDTASRSYQSWIESYDTVLEDDRQQIKAHIQALNYHPLISVVMPVYDTNEEFLRKAIVSVQSQLYENWELCIAYDASFSPHVGIALKEFSSRDPRLRCVRREFNGNVCAASNMALGLAMGEFVGFMDHDDLLPETALYEVVVELNRYPQADLVYSDNDHVDDNGARYDPHFKSDWNPELFLGCNIVCHLTTIRRSLVNSVGGFRMGYEGSQDYDLALRIVRASAPERIRHIPAILYHWRRSPDIDSFPSRHLDKCIAAARRAKNDDFKDCKEQAQTVENPFIPSYDRIVRSLPAPPPLVTLVVPTKNKYEVLGPCIAGLLHRTDYCEKEIIIIDHQSDDPATLKLLERLGSERGVRIIKYEGPFNYSEMNNRAVQQARGDIIAFINNDVDVIDPGWLSEMASLAVVRENGAIGAKLLYSNDSVQHAGMVLGIGGIAGHMFKNWPITNLGYCGRLAMTSNVSAVTGACLVLRKSLFEDVGGFDAKNLPVAFNDVDLCLRIQAAGYRNVWTPFALLYHHESYSRGSDLSPENMERARSEANYMHHTWGDKFNNDPFYNLNLSLKDENFNLAFPPRREKPWRLPEFLIEPSGKRIIGR